MSRSSHPPTADQDEVFWQAQEKRKKGALHQPCCTQSKMSWALMDIPGNLAVVIHGEFDCLNCFHHHVGRNAFRFYSTRLTSQQITLGDTRRPLAHLLRLIAEQRRPDAIVVLGTCPVAVIGDRFDEVVDDVARATSIPMVALHTNGLALSSLMACQDWLFSALAGLPQLPSPADERRANVIGMPELGGQAAEPIAVLGAAGIEVAGFYPHGASLDDWRSIGHAGASFIADLTAYKRLTRQLTKYHQPVVEVPVPVGFEQTRRFYKIIGDHFEVGDAIQAAIQAQEAEASHAVEAFRRRHQGTTLGMTVRMLNTYRVDQLVYDGLVDLPLFEELGFEVTLLVQGPPEEAPRFRQSMRDRGVQAPLVVFPGPWMLADALRRGRFQVCCVPDSSRNTAAEAGVPMVPSRSMAPYFAGIEGNLTLLERLIKESR